MPFSIPAIYPITDRRLSSLSHFEQVERLISGGATIIQIRDKTAPADWFEDARRSIGIARDANVRSIINDRVDIALALGADGVHLGQDDLPPQEARKLLGKDAIIGFSTHSIEQIRSAIDLPVDYIAFGPIFDTSTKSNPDETVGLEQLLEACRLKGDMPLVAIGGIDDRNLTAVLAAGANSAAMIGNLVSDAARIERRMCESLCIASR